LGEKRKRKEGCSLIERGEIFLYGTKLFEDVVKEIYKHYYVNV
jgi:hypothetical protein